MPTMAQVTAATEHQMYQGTRTDGAGIEIADTHLPLYCNYRPPCDNHPMSIRSRRDFEKLRAIGRIVRETLDRTAAAVKPGITTAELRPHRARKCSVNMAPRPASAQGLRFSRCALHQRQR